MTNEQMDPDILQIWRFVRGDLSIRDFEDWLYNSNDIEAKLGPLYLDVISANYNNAYIVHKIAKQLASWARRHTPLSCLCYTLPNIAVIDMGYEEDVFRSLEKQLSRGDPYWWLYTTKCSVCGECWLVAQEELHNDIFCMLRLEKWEFETIQNDTNWPSDFDRYEDLLRIGRENGRRVRFVDPLDNLRNIRVLARARPGITVYELMTLLNIEASVALQLAKTAVEEEGLNITFDVT